MELVPCSGLFKIPFSWSIARACLQEMRSVEAELTTTAQYQGKSLEPVNQQLNWVADHVPLRCQCQNQYLHPAGRASSTPSACDRYLACRKKRPGASKVGHVWRMARVGGAETQGQLPLTGPVPKPTPDVVITCTRRVPLHDSRHELVHGTIATQCCWKLELKPWATRLELESQRPMWRLECDGSQLWTWRDST